MEEFGCSEGPHEGVDPHRHYKEHYGHSAPVQLLVGKDPCRRVAEKYAEEGVLYRNFKRKCECSERIGIGEELGEVVECEVAGTVLKCIEHDQDQRQRDKQHQEYRVWQSPGTSFIHRTS